MYSSCGANCPVLALPLPPQPTKFNAVPAGCSTEGAVGLARLATCRTCNAPPIDVSNDKLLHRQDVYNKFCLLQAGGQRRGRDYRTQRWRSSQCRSRCSRAWGRCGSRCPQICGGQTRGGRRCSCCGWVFWGHHQTLDLPCEGRSMRLTEPTDLRGVGAWRSTLLMLRG